jgi:hypothetical protein
MSRGTEKLKTDLKKSLADLETVSDEVRLKLHLAGMDAKKEWRELERELEAARKDVDQAVNEATREALDEAIAKLRKFRAALH